MTPDRPPPDLGLTDPWFASGVATPASAADFQRLAAAGPPQPPRAWRWALFRDFVEERCHLSADECRRAARLAETEADAGLGTAIVCAVLYQAYCPVDLIDQALSADRPAVRRAAAIRRGGA